MIWVFVVDMLELIFDLLSIYGLLSVIFLRWLEFGEFDYVGIENVVVMFVVINYLLDLGYLKIVYFGGEVNVDVCLECIDGC